MDFQNLEDTFAEKILKNVTTLHLKQLLNIPIEGKNLNYSSVMIQLWGNS